MERNINKELRISTKVPSLSFPPLARSGRGAIQSVGQEHGQLVHRTESCLQAEATPCTLLLANWFSPTGFSLMRFGNSGKRKQRSFSMIQSQRDCITQPSVAELARLRWVHESEIFSYPERVASTRSDDATPLGLMDLSIRLPRVARSSQPWAERWNPVGIHVWSFRKALG